ncbi:hypothetical protein A3709_08845 [Halioglobus sp. HI00S01]|nr:hypothetical protein [Halioglobus sp. HI00S01]KZX55087.1 hypothetical protein A3709_08845 [Halioglobus sp. HI00S01]
MLISLLLFELLVGGIQYSSQGSTLPGEAPFDVIDVCYREPYRATGLEHSGLDLTRFSVNLAMVKMKSGIKHVQQSTGDQVQADLFVSFPMGSTLRRFTL